MSENAAWIVIGLSFVALPVLLWRLISIESARRMWKEAQADPKKMRWIERFLKHGPPPGL